MKKLLYCICFSFFCFLLVSVPSVAQANGITSNGGISFTPASKEPIDSSTSEQKKSDTNTKVGYNESSRNKRTLPRTNTTNGYFITFLGLGMLLVCVVFFMKSKQ